MSFEPSEPQAVITEVVSRAARHGVVVDPTEVIKILSTAVSGDPSQTQTDPSKYVIPHSRVFIKAPVVMDIGWDLATAAAVCALFHDGPQAAIATALQRLLRTMRLLTPEEADLIVVLTALSGGNAETRGVPTWRIEQAYEEDAPKVAPLLSQAARSGVLVETHEGWRLVH